MGTSHPVSLVVCRAEGRWWVAPLGADAPAPVGLTELVQVLHSAGWAGIARRGRPRGGVPTGLQVGPVAAFVARLQGDRLVVAGGRSGPADLDGDDLALIDGITAPTGAEGLADGSDAAARAFDLVHHGVLRAVLAGTEGYVDIHPSARRPAPVVPPPPLVAEVRALPVGGAADDTRIPVYSVWHPHVGPLLSLGMLTAAARHHDGGALNACFDIRPPESAESFLADLATRRGPAVLLSSDYVFTLEDNLDVARAARRFSPDLVVLHGGPSSPKYPEDAERFLHDHADVAHVLARGEGERTVCELLEALVGTLPALDADRLGAVEGISFRHPDSGEVVRTPDRERIAELDTLPSPFLTGEFDHIPPAEWTQPPFFETNRGCPYGCTFCDWGSATQSRIRKFDLDRVTAELEWAASRGLAGAYLCDANFGILPRDVEIAQALVSLRQRYGSPKYVMFTPAKNTTRHLTRILDTLAAGDVSVATSISLQTTDDATLDLVGRHNISTDAYLALAADLRRRGHALTGDLILGLPGQTYDTYRADLQFMLDHEIMPRTFPCQLLPNSVMNDPEYRSANGIVTDDGRTVLATATLSASDRSRGLRLRRIEAVAERYGLLRHVDRYLQWDHGIPATDVMDAVLQVVLDSAGAYPSVEWTFTNFDLFPTPLGGWAEFYNDVRRLLVDRFGVVDDSGLRTVLDLQQFLMPAPGRTFPATIDLAHDYLGYYLSATDELYRSGHAGRPTRPLREHAPARFEVRGDPLGLCDTGLWFVGNSRDDVVEGDFLMGSLAANELDSDLVRVLPRLAGLPEVVDRRLSLSVDPSWSRDADAGSDGAVGVALGRTVTTTPRA